MEAFFPGPYPTAGSATHKYHDLPARPLRLRSIPPAIRLPARRLCPLRFVSTNASPYTALSRTTLACTKDKALCGISRVQVGASLAICLCDQETLSWTVALPNAQRIDVSEMVVR